MSGKHAPIEHHLPFAAVEVDNASRQKKVVTSALDRYNPRHFEVTEFHCVLSFCCLQIGARGFGLHENTTLDCDFFQQ